MYGNAQSKAANRRSILDRGSVAAIFAQLRERGSACCLEDNVMQSDQRTTNHPIPFRHAEHASDIDGNHDVAERNDVRQHRDSSDRHDATKPAMGRRPARSAENMPRNRR
jgi:hypothetical protein